MGGGTLQFETGKWEYQSFMEKKADKQLFAEKSDKIFWVEGFSPGSVNLHETISSFFFFVSPF